MKWVRSTEEGYLSKPKMMQGEGLLGRPQTVSKAVGVLSGNQKCVLLYGMKLWVDGENTVIRGPDVLIGLDFDRLKKVPYAVIFDIASSVSRGVNVFNNESHSPEEKAAIKETENAKMRMAKAIENWNRSRYEQIAPGTIAR